MVFLNDPFSCFYCELGFGVVGLVFGLVICIKTAIIEERDSSVLWAIIIFYRWWFDCRDVHNFSLCGYKRPIAQFIINRGLNQTLYTLTANNSKESK